MTCNILQLKSSRKYNLIVSRSPPPPPPHFLKCSPHIAIFRILTTCFLAELGVRFTGIHGTGTNFLQSV